MRVSATVERLLSNCFVRMVYAAYREPGSSKVTPEVKDLVEQHFMVRGLKLEINIPPRQIFQTH